MKRTDHCPLSRFLRTINALGLFALWPAAAQTPNAAWAPPEPLGPCSRRSPLVISEILYHPPARVDGRDLSFIELYNSQPWFADLSGFRLTGDIEYAFPEGTRLAGQAFLVVAEAPADLQADYSITNVLGPYTGDLGRDSGTLRLEHRSGAVLLEIDYSNQPPWPVAADGAGASLVLARPTFGEGDPRAWSASHFVGGSPGEPEPAADDPLRAVVINEVSANPPSPSAPFIELYNHGATELDLSGCSLSDDPQGPGFVIPSGTRIAGSGLVVFEKSQLGFQPSAAGGALFLAAPDRTAILDAVRYGGQATGLPEGRSPDGSPVWRALVQPTPGAANAGFFIHDIVINEIMYHPISDAKEDEYLELRNSGTRAVDLSGWRFVDGIEYTFPAGAVLAAGGHLVVAKDAARLRTRHPHLTTGNTFGDYGGALSDAGERVALARPETVRVPDGQGGWKTTVADVLVDEVTYGEAGRWGEWADGGGSSLELIHPRTDHRHPANWADSDESVKAAWTTIEFTGRVDNYMNVGVSDSLNLLQVLLLGSGECLLDDVEAMRVGETNQVMNPAFDAGVTRWLGHGNHSRVQWEATGGEDGPALRLQSGGRGDPAGNYLQGQRARAFRKEDMATLRARVRWLHGSPEILLRVPGNYLEAYGRMPVPRNLGTPGLPNSRAVGSVGPAIAAVAHWPVLPSTNQPVVITAQVQAAEGRPVVTLNYRLDPSTNVVSVPMADDGSGDDAVAGDGIYSATIPGQSSPQLIAFHIVVFDGTHSEAVRVFPSDAPARECLVRVGEPGPAGQLGVYRIWMTDAAKRRWIIREKLSSDPLDATFVNGRHRVIYGAGAMYAGSAYRSDGWSGPTGAPCDYAITFPADDRFLGATETTLSWPGLPPYPDSTDPTAQSEQAAYWIAEQLGLPFCYRRYVVTYYNGVRRNAVLEDTQQPNRDFIEQWFPRDPAGDLYKMQAAYDLNGALLQFGSLENFAIADSRQKLARYRWGWGKRSAPGAVNDSRSFLELVNAVNLPPEKGYGPQVERLIDLDQWARTMAVERLIGNWDSFGYATGQNMYFYKPTAGPWQLVLWDLDFLMGGAVADLPTRDLFVHQGILAPQWTADPTTKRLFLHPPFRRAYLRALQAVITGPLLEVNALMDAKAAAFNASGLKLAPPTIIKNYLSARRAYIAGQLDKFRAPFALTHPTGDEQRSREAVLTLSGTASFEVQTLTVNGLAYPATWTSATNWSLLVPLRQLTQEFVVVGLDAAGQPMPAARQSVTVTYAGDEPLAPTHVVINEWMAANGATLADPADGDFEDWFELYNPNPYPVDLSGYQLTDDPTAPVRSEIAPGVSIAPGGFRLVWADGELSQNRPDSDLHVGFNLRRSGEAILLLDPAGRLVDQVTFGSQSTDVSQGRWPDGADGPFPLMPQPTPGAANVVPEAMSPLRIVGLTLSPPGVATLTWTADLGATYRVRFKDRLETGDWSLAAEVMAAGPTATVTLTTDTAEERYYEVLGLP